MFVLSLSSVTDSSDHSIITTTTKKVNAFTRYWDSLNWDQIISRTISVGLSLILIAIVFLVIRKVGQMIIRRTFKNYQRKTPFSENRVLTLEKLSLNVFSYTILFFFLYSMLTEIGIPVGSLLAGAGIAGLAIGLGAQGFINDIITGFVIIMERQIDVGDHVRLGAIEGIVLAVGLRTTEVKSFDGTVHYIPNRSITIVSNLSRANMRVQIDVRLKPDADIPFVTEIIENVNQQSVPEYPEIVTGPDIFGMVDLGGGNFAIRIIMYTKNGAQGKIQQEFLTAYIEALTQKGIQIPSSPLNLSI